MKTVVEVDALVGAAHAGQLDKIGVPYADHVRAVAAGLAHFGPDLEMAGLLHDIVEDTDWTAGRLRSVGVPDHVVGIVQAVTNQRDMSYEEKIRRITRSRDATLVKIADNAHNSIPERAAQLPAAERDRLAAKYRAARDVLWAAADPAQVESIIAIVNPALLTELRERLAG
ncbi:HD domain-containing protein [Streptomyces beijiangensis]|uniref:HD domain-containing protein n=1 Tax=Streptomyces beijiangensis TaxID=163361 RepID=A0A939F261_9ACTN|nr:HD domain-containing protein [Streptomyces beijiangensis]MBO0510383.1 HD domain-containing protein [Streptomyces beijiangensis]